MSRLRDSSEPMIGRQLSHYVILEKAGEGGMGIVYKARDTALDRLVALKTLRPGQNASPERRRRFIQEARTASALDHPNIVGVYEIDSAEGVDFIAMEWVDGSGMDRVIPHNGLPLRQALNYGLQVADALNRAHGAGIIHRDLKPANLLVARDGAVKVADFGLAKLTQQSESDPNADTATFKQEQLTEQGAVLGTVAYMSPEQAEGKALDTRSDIFSFGAVLYEMITGHRAFAGETRVSTMAAILTRDPKPLTDYVPNTPPELERVVSRCLRKEPERRLQHMGDVRLALAELIEELVSGKAALGIPVSRRRQNIRRLAWAGIALAGILAALGAGIVLAHRRSIASDWSRNAVFEQLTDEPGEELFPSISPDGNSFVYASRKSGEWHIYLRRVGGRNAIDLTPNSTGDNTQPAFSPDGQIIAFRSSRAGGGIFVMGATGESVRRITDFGFNPAWSPDGTQIACTAYPYTRLERRSNVHSRLWIVEPATARRRAIEVADALQPSWSPHGFRIAYAGYHGKGRYALGIWTCRAQAGGPPDPVYVTSGWNPVWSPDGAWLYFADGRNGAMNLWRVRMNERSGTAADVPEPAPVPSTYIGHISFARDRDRMLYTQMRSAFVMRSADFDPRTERLSESRPLRNTLTGLNPHLSPDGRKLAYGSEGRGEALFVSGPDGEDPHQVTDGLRGARAPRWSPDGKSLVFYSNRSGAYEVWTIAADGSGLRQLSQTGGVWFPAWSPDDSRISYYAIDAGSYMMEVSASGAPGRVVPIGAPDPALMAWSWSPDGRRLAMQRHTETALFAGFGVHDLKTGSFRLLSPEGGAPEWLNDNRRILFHAGGRWKIADADGSAVRELGPAPEMSERYCISPDNRRIYFVAREADADIWMVRHE